MSPTTGTARLARIQLNTADRAVQRDLRDATELHRTLMRLAPDRLGDSPRLAAGLLYRVDESEHATTLLVQAGPGLDTARLPAGYGRAEVRDLTPMFDALAEGLGVRYRIVVNPSKRERVGPDREERHGRVVPLSGEDADAWWARRATAAGLRLHSLLPTPVPPVRPRNGRHGAMRHSLVRYDGTATVTDPAALTEAVLNGVGRGKPYGAGLLSLAPARAG